MSGESSTQMQVDKPPKLDLDFYLSTTLSTAPVELHTFIESFKTLHRRKYAYELFTLTYELIFCSLSKAMASTYIVCVQLLRPPAI